MHLEFRISHSYVPWSLRNHLSFNIDQIALRFGSYFDRKRSNALLRDI